MNIRIPIVQSILLVIISVIIGISSNMISSNPIPLLAVELAVVEKVEINSDEPILAADIIRTSKSFLR